VRPDCACHVLRRIYTAASWWLLRHASWWHTHHWRRLLAKAGAQRSTLQATAATEALRWHATKATCSRLGRGSAKTLRHSTTKALRHSTTLRLRSSTACRRELDGTQVIEEAVRAGGALHRRQLCLHITQAHCNCHHYRCKGTPQW